MIEATKHYFYCETSGKDKSEQPLWKGIIVVEDPEELGTLLEAKVKPILREIDPYGARIVNVWRLSGEGIMTMTEECGFII